MAPTQSAQAATRRRGRPSNAEIMERIATRSSSASTSAPRSRGSSGDYTTPETSYVATPTTTSVADKSEAVHNIVDLKGKGKAIEVVIPAITIRAKDKGKGKATTARTRSAGNSRVKGKSVIYDSEDVDMEPLDDSEDELSADHKGVQVAHDAKVARALQEQLDAQMAAEVMDDEAESELSVLSDREIALDETNLDDNDDDDFKAGPSTSRRTSSRVARRTQTLHVSDSEDWSEDLDDDDYDMEEPPRKKQKVSRVRAVLAVPVVPSFVPASRLGTRSTRSTNPDPTQAALDLNTSEDGEFDAPGVSGASDDDDGDQDAATNTAIHAVNRNRRAYRGINSRRLRTDREKLEEHHPELKTMWKDLEAMPILKAGKATQPHNITRQLKPFQLEGLAWMKEMEKSKWKGGLLGDEMGLGKTIQAVSLIMSDFPAKQPSLVLVPPVALMQWVSEIDSYTDGTLKTLVFHITNTKSKGLRAKDLQQYDVIIMSYNSLESMYRKQEKGFARKDGTHKEKSIIHATHFHRVILDEAHSIKSRTTMTAKATFALKMDYRWCLSGTPLQNRIGEFFSLVRFLNVTPFASYFCKECPCNKMEWNMDDDGRCKGCEHHGMQHVSVFNQELLNPIQRHGNFGPGKEAFQKLRLMTDRIMLRRLKKDNTDSMELPVKEIYVDRQFFGEEENDFANSIMTSGQRKFDTYVAQGVMLNNYANIFGLIMQMRQVADHPDLILKKDGEGGQNIMVCCICDEPAEEAIRSRCKHDFCRACAKAYLASQEQPDCPRCHIPLSIDLEQPDIKQDEFMVKKSSIINRIKMDKWTSSSKIELLVHELHALRSNHASHKSIIFSQFTTMLQLVEWRLRRAGITTVMLDGSMTPAQRAASIDHFMKNPEVECFLVSLKAGGVALNLTEASRVFIVDPWWNPAAEWQSADRCHRIGQTRPCTITRLCIEDSVESRMVLLQEKKTNMINSTINSDDAAMESLTPEDLQFLFRGN